MSSSYIRDSLDCAFDGCDLWPLWDGLTEEQREAITRSMEISIENMSMATGRDCIPNPQDAEVRRRDASLKAALVEASKREEALLALLGRQVRIDPRNLHLGNDGGLYRHDGRTERILW